MNSGLKYFFLLLIFSTTVAYSQKILRVQGNKVVISARGIDISEGDVLSVTSDGFEAGKVKILSVNSKTAIGKITEGSALKGDSVQTSGSSGRKSSKSSSSSGSSKGKNRSGSTGTGFGAHLGLSYAMLSNITSQQGDYTQDGQMGLFLMGEYRTGKSIYHFGLRTGAGDATFTAKVSNLVITNPEITTTNIFARISNPISKNLYFTYGAQFSMVSVEDNMQTNLNNGAHTIDLKGLGALGGVGYDLILGSFILKAESLLEINYYFMNTSTVPGESGDYDPNAFMIYGIHFNFSVGYRF